MEVVDLGEVPMDPVHSPAKLDMPQADVKEPGTKKTSLGSPLGHKLAFLNESKGCFTA